MARNSNYNINQLVFKTHEGEKLERASDDCLKSIQQASKLEDEPIQEADHSLFQKCYKIHYLIYNSEICIYIKLVRHCKLQSSSSRSSSRSMPP